MEISEIKSENESHIEDGNEEDDTDDFFEPTNELKSEQNYDEEIEEFNAGRFFIENFFKMLTLVTMQTFKVLNMALDQNVGWGLLVIIFFLVNSAKAAPMGNEISEISGINATEPGPVSYTHLRAHET